MSSTPRGEQWIAGRRKRTFDICVSSALLPLAAPVVALGAVAFSIENGINPLFLQDRLGRGDLPLKVAKLRTMPFAHDLSDGSNGYADARATRVGRFLRKATIDELPQLAQVLAGQMSIVGPRPLISADVEKTMDILSPQEQRDWRHARSLTKPGLLSEFGNESRYLVPQSEAYLTARVDADCRYIRDASEAIDMAIIRGAFGVAAATLESGNATRLSREDQPC